MIITEEDIKKNGINVLDNLLKEGAVHISSKNKQKYVILTEEDYKDMARKAFEVETLISEREYKKGNLIKGNSNTLFKDLGI